MGCFSSSCRKDGERAPKYSQTSSRGATHVEQGAPRFTGGITDSDLPPPHEPKLTSSTWQMSHLGQAPHYEDTAAPSYERLTWLNRVLEAFCDAQTILARHSISYHDLVHTETHFVIDDYHRYTDKEKAGIAIMAGTFQGLLRAIEARAVMTFMTYQNPERSSLTEEEEEAAICLDTIYRMPNANSIFKALKADNLPSLLKKKKLKRAKGDEAASNKVTAHTRGGKSTDQHGALGNILLQRWKPTDWTDRVEEMGTLKEEVDSIMRDETIKPNQRHSRMLALIRDMRYDFSESWDLSSVDFEKFLALYETAQNDVKEQPKLTSNLSYNIIRLIQRQRADWHERTRDNTGAVSKQKIIVITAGDVSETDFDHLTAELGLVTGGASEFSIQVIHLNEKTASASAKYQQRLDDSRQGTADIYDYTPIHLDQFLHKFLSGHAIAKILFSEHPQIDALQASRKTTFYGNMDCVRPENRIELPAAEHFKKRVLETAGPITTAAPASGPLSAPPYAPVKKMS